MTIHTAKTQDVKPWAYLIAGPCDSSGVMTYWSKRDGWTCKSAADVFWSNQQVEMPGDSVGPVMIQQDIIVTQVELDQLSSEELMDKYSPDCDGEHPVLTRELWRAEVEQQTTVSGY